jgi:hypothetical protein
VAQAIRVFVGKKCPKALTLGLQSREIRNPDRSDGKLKRSTHTCVRVSVHRASGVGERVTDVASSEIVIVEVPTGKGKGQR